MDHVSKLFIGLLQRELRSALPAILPDEQCGCVAVRGTSFVHHSARLFTELAAIKRTSLAMFLIDLSAAFDTAVRENAYGLDQGECRDPFEVLSSVGLRGQVLEEAYRNIVQYRSVPENAGVPRKIVRLIAAAHSRSWYVFGDDPDEAFVTHKGG